MRKFNSENERLKRKYIAYLEETKGQDYKSLNKVAASLVRFEKSTKFKPFKKFHIDQARQFKNALSKAKNPTTGKPLSLTTIDLQNFEVLRTNSQLAWARNLVDFTHGVIRALISPPTEVGVPCSARDP